MMLKHRATAILAAAAVAATTLAFTASAAVKDVQADTMPTGIDNISLRSEPMKMGKRILSRKTDRRFISAGRKTESAMTAVSYTASPRLSRRILSGYQKR